MPRNVTISGLLPDVLDKIVFELRERGVVGREVESLALSASRARRKQILHEIKLDCGREIYGIEELDLLAKDEEE